MLTHMLARNDSHRDGDKQCIGDKDTVCSCFINDHPPPPSAPLCLDTMGRGTVRGADRRELERSLGLQGTEDI